MIDGIPEYVVRDASGKARVMHFIEVTYEGTDLTIFTEPKVRVGDQVFRNCDPLCTVTEIP